MAKLSKEQWQEARQLWESDSSLSYKAIGDKFGTSKQAVTGYAKRNNWTRENVVADIDVVDNINARKLAIDKLVEIIADKDTPKKLVIAACAELINA